MIEFKGECGHTIRAKDGDEGKVVRCSYCGREAQVPTSDENELDFLFSELGSAEAGEARGRKPARVKKRPPGGIGPESTRGGFNPFAVAVKMGYGAIIIIVLIVAAKKAHQYLGPMLDRQSSSGQRNSARAADQGEEPAGRPGEPRRGYVCGKLSRRSGILVTAVPADALVRYRELSDRQDLSEVSLFGDPDPQIKEGRAPVTIDHKGSTLSEWEVAVAVPDYDAQLRRYPGYDDLRRRLRDDREGALDNADAYFLPDGAIRLSLVKEPQRPMLLVRTYRVAVTGAHWVLVTALFLPDQPLEQNMPYLPRKRCFGFDEDLAREELGWFEVPADQGQLIIDALQRIGSVTYQDLEDEYLKFSVALPEGTFVGERYTGPLPPGGSPRRGRKSR